MWRFLALIVTLLSKSLGNWQQSAVVARYALPLVLPNQASLTGSNSWSSRPAICRYLARIVTALSIILTGHCYGLTSMVVVAVQTVWH